MKVTGEALEFAYENSAALSKFVESLRKAADSNERLPLLFVGHGGDVMESEIMSTSLSMIDIPNLSLVTSVDIAEDALISPPTGQRADILTRSIGLSAVTATLEDNIIKPRLGNVTKIKVVKEEVLPLAVSQSLEIFGESAAKGRGFTNDRDVYRNRLLEPSTTLVMGWRHAFYALSEIYATSDKPLSEIASLQTLQLNALGSVLDLDRYEQMFLKRLGEDLREKAATVEELGPSTR